MVNEFRNAPIQEPSIRSILATRELGRRLLILENCTSTNDVAAECASHDVVHGFTVVSEVQTKGRGRFGREWTSPYGGIWMTIVLRTSSNDSVATLPMLGALAIVLALRSRGVMALVRWPNDVMVDEKKLAGVMVETKFEGNVLTYALLGLGINANFHSTELQGLATKSTTLLELLGSPVDRNSVICDILVSIEQLCDDVFSGLDERVLELLCKNECSLGREVIVEISDSRIKGLVQRYESLTKVAIATVDQKCRSIETGSVVSVEYVDD